jgi:formate dehydrogenase maturation protein FdhE
MSANDECPACGSDDVGAVSFSPMRGYTLECADCEEKWPEVADYE